MFAVESVRRGEGRRFFGGTERKRETRWEFYQVFGSLAEKKRGKGKYWGTLLGEKIRKTDLVLRDFLDRAGRPPWIGGRGSRWKGTARGRRIFLRGNEERKRATRLRATGKKKIQDWWKTSKRCLVAPTDLSFKTPQKKRQRGKKKRRGKEKKECCFL